MGCDSLLGSYKWKFLFYLGRGGVHVENSAWDPLVLSFGVFLQGCVELREGVGFG